MPWPLTQAQQAYGTGSQEDWRLAGVPPVGGVASPNVFTGQNPTDADRRGTTDQYAPWNPALMYASLFGTMTPQQRVNTPQPAGAVGADSRMTGVTPGGGGPGPDGMAPPAKPVAASPQQAGVNNSVYPGWSTGNQEVGVAASETGISPLASAPPLQGRSPTDPLNVALGGAPPVNRQPTLAPGQVPTGMYATGAPAGPAKSVPAGQAPDDGTRGPTMDPAAKPGAEPGGVPQPGKNDFGLGIDNKHKPPVAPLAGFQTTFTGADPKDASKLAVQLIQSGGPGGAYLAKLVLGINQLVYGTGGTKQNSLASLMASGEAQVAGGKGGVGKLRQANDAIAYLKSMGVNYDPLSAMAGTTPPGTTPPSGDGTPPPPAGDGTPPPAGDGTGGGYTPGDLDPTDQRLASVANFIPAALTQINRVWGGGAKTPEAKKFITEQVYALAKEMADAANKNTAYHGALDDQAAFENDPLRVKQVEMANAIMETPDSTPWDVIRNQEISGAHGAIEDASNVFGSSAARRLGSAGVGAQPGLYANLAARGSGALNTRLGDLEIQKAATTDAARQRAIQIADAVRASTTGADIGVGQNIQRLLGGAVPLGNNPLSGMNSVYPNMQTFYTAQNADADASLFDQLLSGFQGLTSGLGYSQGQGGSSGTGLGGIISMLGLGAGV